MLQICWQTFRRVHWGYFSFKPSHSPTPLDASPIRRLRAPLKETVCGVYRCSLLLRLAFFHRRLRRRLFRRSSREAPAAGESVRVAGGSGIIWPGPREHACPHLRCPAASKLAPSLRPFSLQTCRWRLRSLHLAAAAAVGPDSSHCILRSSWGTESPPRTAVMAFNGRHSARIPARCRRHGVRADRRVPAGCFSVITFPTAPSRTGPPPAPSPFLTAPRPTAPCCRLRVPCRRRCAYVDVYLVRGTKSKKGRGGSISWFNSECTEVHFPRRSLLYRPGVTECALRMGGRYGLGVVHQWSKSSVFIRRVEKPKDFSNLQKEMFQTVGIDPESLRPVGA